MILTKLMPHQQEAFDYIRQKRQCALFMKLGTGKSLVSLAMANAIKPRYVLITSDKNNVVNTWPDQIAQHTDFKCVVRPSAKALNALFAEKDVVTCVVVNYEYATHRLASLAEVPFSMWIGDECNEFKDQRTDKAKALLALIQRIPRRIMLSGTPMTERLEDMFGQFKVLCYPNSPLGDSISQFRRRYMMRDASGYGWTGRPGAFTQVQRAVKDVSYWAMDLKDVKMPKRHYDLVSVKMTDQQRVLDRQLAKTFAATCNTSRIETNYATTLFLKRYQLMGGTFRPTEVTDKLEYVGCDKMRVLRTIISNNRDKKIVVWHQFIPETARIHAALDSPLIQRFVYSDPVNSRDVLNKFRDHKGGAVLLIRNSMCQGLNQLADADITVIYSNPLSCRDRLQLIGRSCRMTSKGEDTTVVDIITGGGMDEYVYNMVSRKKDCVLTMNRLRGILTSAKTEEVR